MMDDKGNGDKKVVPMLLKNIQFKGLQPQTKAEAVKRPEEAFRRGAATNGIKTKRGPMSYDVQMFAPCTMSKHDPPAGERRQMGCQGGYHTCNDTAHVE